MRWILFAALLSGLCANNFAAAQAPLDAHWMWLHEGDPAAAAPAGKVWFRREVRADEPSTGAVRIACDDKFTLWVNGQKIGSGGGPQSYRYNLNGIVDRGVNVITVEAENTGERAGLLIDGEVRGQSGKAVSFDSGAAWHATAEAPQGDGWTQARFDDAAWRPAKDLGPHETSPWKEISFNETYLDRFQVPEGFKLERIAEPELAGSLVGITWGNRGRLLVSRERSQIHSLIDKNGDGVYDEAVEFCPDLKNCQGLCMVGQVLYAVGDGPQGTGMYRLPDRDADDKADSVDHVTDYKGGMAEHGPHDVVYGPDGWLYHNLGNHAWIKHTPDPTSPIRQYYEGDVLQPRLEDPNGHAVGIPAPGGTIWRFTPNGQKWYLNTNGFRNHYDIAFNAQGELFTFDSDMEWEVGMPFYRPIRVYHCTPGSEFGWRSNAGKWLSYYMDCLPPTVELGRGSPTGVVFYEHRQFPEKYRGAFIVCDWSMGRILSVQLKREGASYRGESETLVSGNPLNVSDIEVERDGSLVFSTGGRGTEGGVYRLSYLAAPAQPATPPVETIEDALSLPQPAAAWSRDLAGEIKNKNRAVWEARLTKAAKGASPFYKIRALTLLTQQGPTPPTGLLIELTSDKDAEVRAFATLLLGDRVEAAVPATLNKLLGDPSPLVQRRACESLVRGGHAGPSEALVKLLGSDDRFVRFAARLALERVPVEKWRTLVLKSADPRVGSLGLLALHRCGPKAISLEASLEWEMKMWDSVWKSPRAEDRLDLLRMMELTIISGVQTSRLPEAAEKLMQVFPARQQGAITPTARAVNMEVSRLLAFLQSPQAAREIVEEIEQIDDRELEIHYAHVTAYLKEGWDAGLNQRMLNWYETTQTWEGGHSFSRWLENIMAMHIDRYEPAERRQLLASWGERPFATRLLLRKTDPDSISDFDAVVRTIMSDLEKQPGKPGGEELLSAAVDALAKSKSAAAQDTLRKLFDESPDRRDQIARALAGQPTAENWPYLVRSLEFGDSTTLQLAISALRHIDTKPEKPAQFRAAILAGLKLGDKARQPAVALLQSWSGVAPPENSDPAAALAHYQAWFSGRYPDEPPAELAAADAGKTKFTVPELVEFLEQTPAGKEGDIARGKLVFTKANCVKCHKFGGTGEGVGPDLSSVRRRFQRREIVESLVLPSQVISDQYRSAIIETVDGQVHVGMPLPNQEKTKVVMLMPDAKRLEIARDQIGQMTPSPISVMPDGILKDLTLSDIADLFAFLETSRQGPEPPKQVPQGN